VVIILAQSATEALAELESKSVSPAVGDPLKFLAPLIKNKAIYLKKMFKLSSEKNKLL